MPLFTWGVIIMEWKVGVTAGARVKNVVGWGRVPVPVPVPGPGPGRDHGTHGPGWDYSMSPIFIKIA